MASRTSDPPASEHGDKRALLAAHPLFKGLDGEIIARLAAHAVMRSAKKGTVLFRKGDSGPRLYAVCTGAVRISAPSAQGKDAIFTVVTPGEIFGEIALLDGGQRTADAVTIEDSELMIVERRDLVPLLREHPELAMRLIEMLCARLRRTSEQVEDIVFLDVPDRLAKALLHLHRRAAEASSGARIRITQREISQMVGVSRESANKQLRDWHRRNWIRLERGGVVVLVPAALGNLVDEAAD